MVQYLVIVLGFLIRSAIGRSPSSMRMTTSCGMVGTVIEVGDRDVEHLE